MYDINQKENFIVAIIERINSGDWGTEEISYLEKNAEKYNLNQEDIGLFIVQVYKYTYAMALEDGTISPEEQEELNQINKIYNSYLPQNRYEREALKNRVSVLVKHFEKQNIVQENQTLEEVYKKDAKLKEKIKSAYPKPTPYVDQK